jgi:hypothetical protein
MTPAERLREAARLLRDDPLTVRPGLEPAVAALLDDMAGLIDMVNDAWPRPVSEETLEMNLAGYAGCCAIARVVLGEP